MDLLGSVQSIVMRLTASKCTFKIFNAHENTDRVKVKRFYQHIAYHLRHKRQIAKAHMIAEQRTS